MLCSIKLKGHQIFGELRLLHPYRMQDTRYWKVTRSLVSYDEPLTYGLLRPDIERSPDLWWVTTLTVSSLEKHGWIERSPDLWWVTTIRCWSPFCRKQLKGHQIFGELRLQKPAIPNSLNIERSPDLWWVTTIFFSCSFYSHRLKGHQIFGELRPIDCGHL